MTLVSYQSFYTDLNAGQSPRWMHAGLMLLISDARELCLESNGTNLFATKQPNLTVIIQSLCLSIFGQIADAKMILMAAPPENWELEETTRASPYHVAEHRPARSESLQRRTERSSQRGSEPPSVEAEAYGSTHSSGIYQKRRRRCYIGQIITYTYPEPLTMFMRSTVRPVQVSKNIKNIDILIKRKNRHHGCIFHYCGGTLPFEPWNPNFACVVGSTT